MHDTGPDASGHPATGIDDLMRYAKTLACLALLALAACSRNEGGPTTAETGNGGDLALPKPEATGGSVTGMPAHPGPGQVGPPIASSVTPPQAASVAVASEAAVPVGDDGANIGATGNNDQASAEPTVADAVGVVREYYRSIDALDYAHAWSLWSDGGRSSGQTPQQFADGFANTAHVTVEIGAPGDVGAAAGSRYIQVPVVIDALQRDGSTQRYAGTYTLRRAVVDGATAEQRAWRIGSAALHPVQP